MKNVACVLTGGPTYKIKIGDEYFPVELNPVCGPTLMHKRDFSRSRINPPKEFWESIDRWVLGGKVIKEDVLIVSRRCEPCRGLGLVDVNTKRSPTFSCVVDTCPNCDGNKVEPIQEDEDE